MGNKTERKKDSWVDDGGRDRGKGAKGRGALASLFRGRNVSSDESEVCKLDKGEKLEQREDGGGVLSGPVTMGELLCHAGGQNGGGGFMHIWHSNRRKTKAV